MDSTTLVVRKMIKPRRSLQGALGITGLIPEMPTVTDVKLLLDYLGYCPDCGGIERDTRNRGCETCDYLFRPFWIDGYEYYLCRSYTAVDLACEVKRVRAQHALANGIPYTEAFKLGPDYYGFHLWKMLHSFTRYG